MLFATLAGAQGSRFLMVDAMEKLPTLKIGETQIDFLGTVHVSRVSRERVAQLLATGEYDAVAVELCERRYQAIVDPDAVARVDLGRVIHERKLGAMAALVALSAYQERLADHFGVVLGGEMKEAVFFARKHKLHLALIDRDIGITFKRLYRSVPWWRRVMLVNSLLFSLFSRHQISEEQIEQMKVGDTLTGLFQDMRALDPCIYDALITERDYYLSAKIISCVVLQKPSRLLVVVGLGHLPGIAECLSRYLSGELDDPAAEVKELEKTPPPSKWLKFIPWVVIGLILAGFAAGFRHNTTLGMELVLDWILINGSLAALGAALAGAHVLTIVTAFLAAPLTSINPTIGAGMVTAAAEVYLRKPTVADFKNIRKDTIHWSGWRRNRVARTLLIFVLSSVGSALGTYIGGFHIYDSL